MAGRVCREAQVSVNLLAAKKVLLGVNQSLRGQKPSEQIWHMAAYRPGVLKGSKQCNSLAVGGAAAWARHLSQAEKTHYDPRRVNNWKPVSISK